MTRCSAFVVVAVAAVALAAGALAGPANAPKLTEVEAAMEELVQSGEVAGVVTLAYRGDRLIHTSALGFRDIEARVPMTQNTIFRAYSMTKPVTAVAMMILYEQGKWRLDDPVTKFLPELAEIKVYKGAGPDGTPILEVPSSVPTMFQLMTHTAGFSYGFGEGYVDDRYRAADIWAATSADEFVRRIASLPLAYEPGASWKYSISVDLQGAIVERLSGESLAAFMERHIFRPLRMNDTGFHVPSSSRPRFAVLYAWSAGRLEKAASPFNMTYAADPGFASGGGGLVTTAADYARFARMLTGRGALEGQRVLTAASVNSIMSTHLSPDLVSRGFGIGFHHFRPGYEYGFDGVVVTDPAEAGVAVGRGTYLWDGAAGTWFWADPENDLVFVGMVQRLMGPGFPPLQPLTQKAVANALPQTAPDGSK